MKWTTFSRPFNSRSRFQFQIMSDLFLETSGCYTTFNIPRRAPFLVLAGNIGRLCNYGTYYFFIHKQCKAFEHVYLVPGNDDFTDRSRDEGLRFLDFLAREPGLHGRLTILNRTRVDLTDGFFKVTLLGCSLYSHIPQEARDLVETRIADFRRTSNWTIDDHNREHARDVKWLKEQMDDLRNELGGRWRRVVVITHYPPLAEGCCNPHDADKPWISMYGSDLLNDPSLAGRFKVHTWIFGHSTWNIDERKGGVKRLVSNQRRYFLSEFSLDEKYRKEPSKSSMRYRLDDSTRDVPSFNVGKVVEF
ncbi:MAG: hypothetical protein M1833_004025 [Piccolia ochrophora]|nr:MAG: hypothetical protein M1833_004025 [Piccolia ochrophora]